MKFGEIIQPYNGQKYYGIKICGLSRKLPIRKVGKNIWIASNAQLVFGCDIEFTKRVGKEIASRLMLHKPQCLLTAEAKSEAMAYEIAKNLGHKEYAIARKSKKAYMKDYISEKVKSITTKEPQELVLDEINLERIRRKRIAIFDDVISTGGTVDGLRKLAEKAKAKVCAIATIWLEGTWPWNKYKELIQSGKLIFLSILPLFASKAEYERLMSEVKNLKNNFLL
jgi:adenine phosphoribosyltransferase